MSNSHLYYIVHRSWNILLSVCPSAGTMAVLCLQGWLASLPFSQDTGNFSWCSLSSLNMPRPVLLRAPFSVGKPHQSIPNFCGWFWYIWIQPTVSILGKPSCVGWRTLTCSSTQLGGRLGASKLLPVGLVVLKKFLCLPRGYLQTPQESQILGEPKMSFLTSTDMEESSF